MPALILAFETATDVCSVALLQNGHVLARMDADRPRAHAESLAPMAQDVFRIAGRAIQELSAVAVSRGPGSYTGLRIGSSTAKGLAFSTGARLVGVPSLPALALAARAALGHDLRAVVVRKARKDELYAAVCDAGDRVRTVEQARLVTTPEAAEAALRALTSTDLPVVLCGNGRMALLDSFGDSADRGRVVLSGVEPDAESVGRLGSRLLDEGRTDDIDTFEPYYLKEYVAERPRSDIFSRLPF